MSVIFLHRVVERKRRFVFSALIPYVYILSLGIGLLLMTLVAGSLQAVGKESVDLFGRHLSLSGFSGLLLYLLGFGFFGFFGAIVGGDGGGGGQDGEDDGAAYGDGHRHCGTSVGDPGGWRGGTR